MNIRRFQTKGRIDCQYTRNGTTLFEQISNIEVQLWQKAPMTDILLGKGLTDAEGFFRVDFEEDSPNAQITDGKMYDVFIKAFYNGEELELFTLRTGIVAYWKLDETDGTTAADATGNGHEGVLSGTTPPTWTTGKINNGLEINGGLSGTDDSYLAVASSPDFDFSDNDFSISLWMKSNNTSGSYNLFDSGFPARDSFAFEFIVPDIINFYQGEKIVYTKEFSVSTATWYHIVVRRKENTMEVFINGTSLGQSPFTGLVTCPAPHLLIGKYSDGESLDGVIDEMGIWKGRALTDAQISKLYNAGSGLQYPF